MDAMASIQPHRLYLGSASPRRKALLEGMGLVFEVLQANIEETYPDGLRGHEIADFLALDKARALEGQVEGDGLLITADTVVWFQNEVMEKPADADQARTILGKLSGQWHEVITSVCFTRQGEQRLAHAVTGVKFGTLNREMIDTYLRRGHPLDKAGAYGIQEWIGLVGVEAIRGSYTNVVGLPTQLVYEVLRDMAARPAR